MKVLSISKSLVVPCFLLLASGCTNEAEQKAKETATKYLTGTELLQAENNSYKLPTVTDNQYNNQVLYWDSIVTAAKAKEAYIRGGQMVKDSLAGKDYRKPEYKMPIDTVVLQTIYEITNGLEAECAKYYNANELLNLRNQKPKLEQSLRESSSPQVIHYWNLLTRTGEERKAFNAGAEAERAKLNK